MKLCKKCNLQFNEPRCKPCDTIASKNRYLLNKDKYLASRMIARKIPENIEKQKIKNKKYYINNKVNILTNAKIWAKNNKQKVNLISRNWRKNNPEKAKIYCFNWKLKNKESCRVYDKNRRALKITAIGKISNGLFEKLFILQKGKCPVCKALLYKTTPRSPMDHIIPLSKGGSNSNENIQILCKPCNSSKYNKDPVEFMQSMGFLL